MAKGIKISYIDRLFSKYIRARAGWKCERCGKYYGPGHSGLHCSHLFSRRHKATRFNPSNAFSHCFGCHAFLGGNPVYFTGWAEGYLGEDTVEALKQQAMTPTKLTDADKKQIAADIRGWLEELGEKP